MHSDRADNTYILAADCSFTNQILKRANKGCAKTALVQVFGVAQVDDLVNQLQKKRQNVFCMSSLMCKQWQRRHPIDWLLTFPLMSCSTMFSGLRSLWMILFSWRYWIPDPASIKQRHNLTIIWTNTGTLRNSIRQDVPTSLSNDSTSLSFRPQQFSGLLSNWKQHNTHSNYISRKCTLLSGQRENWKLSDLSAFQNCWVNDWTWKAPTFLRSPLEQYSMARRGRSFKAISLISSGTSLAVTTLMWFNLGHDRFIAGLPFYDNP